jgi:hypothetical protein
MPLWFYFQSSGDLSIVDGSMLGVNFRHIQLQVNLALLYGAKGLQYYNITNGIIRRADGKKYSVSTIAEVIRRKENG